MDNLKNKTLSSIIFKDKITNFLTRFHAFTGNDYISSINKNRKGSIL